MKLRTLTIWTSRLTLIATFLLAFVYFFVRASHYSNFSVVTETIPCLFVGFLCNLPLIVSCIILLFLKHPVSLALLLFSTILYGIGILFAFCSAWGNYSCMSGIEFFGVSITSFFFLIPVWILALVLNSYYVKKKNPDPGIATQEE